MNFISKIRTISSGTMETLSDLYLQDVGEDAIYVPEYPISCKELYQDSRFKVNETQWKNDYPVTVSFSCDKFQSNLDTFLISKLYNF